MDVKILIVDGSPVQLKILQVILSELGFKAVLTAGNSVQALKILEKEPSICMIFSEWDLPDQTGQDLHKSFSEKGGPAAAIPLFLCFRKKSKEEILAAAQDGIKGFVVKPYKKEVVNKLIRDALQSNNVKQDSGNPAKDRSSKTDEDDLSRIFDKIKRSI